MPRWMATEEDEHEAAQRLLVGLSSGQDVAELTATIADLHRKNNTFPGEIWVVSQTRPARTPPSRESLCIQGFLSRRPWRVGSYSRFVGMKVGMIYVAIYEGPLDDGTSQVRSFGPYHCAEAPLDLMAPVAAVAELRDDRVRFGRTRLVGPGGCRCAPGLSRR